MKNLILTEDYSSIGKCEEIRVSYENSTDLVWIDKPSKYEFVDLGLPSGTLWATCNVGANSPEEFGLYFAWGETKGWSKEQIENGEKYFDFGDNYKFGEYEFPNKYNADDNLINLELVDDAAYQSDNSCRIPTFLEFKELVDNTIFTVESINDIYVGKFTANNGNFIILPFGGVVKRDNIYDFPNCADYWTSTLDAEHSGWAYYLYMDSYNDISVYNGMNRANGLLIRPVKYK